MRNKKSFFLKVKFITIGVVIGVLGTAATTSIAAQISSLVGKKIQAEYVVNVDGKKSDTKAIVVDGVSHLPVRKVSEIYGADIQVKDKVISLNTNQAADNSSDLTQAKDSSSVRRKVDNTNDIEGYKTSLKVYDGLIKDAEDYIKRKSTTLENAIKDGAGDKIITELRQGITEAEKNIKDLEAQKANVQEMIKKLEEEQNK